MEVTAAPQATDTITIAQRLYKIIKRVTGSYTFRVVVQGALTLWAVTTFTFFLIRKMPGNPVQIKIDQLMDQRQLTYEEARRSADDLGVAGPPRGHV